MKDCHEIEGYIERYLWGETTPEEVASFESHTASCAGCRAAFTAAAAFDTAMKGAFPAWAAEVANPRAAVLEQITVGNLMSSRPPSWKTVRWRAVRWVLLFGLLAALAVSFEGLATVAVAKRELQRDVAAVEVKAIGHWLELYRESEESLPESGNRWMVARLIQTLGRSELPSYPFERDRVSDGQALDPWDEPYVYRSTGDSFTLYSKGENRRDDRGGEDDIPYSPPSKGRGG